MSVELNATTTPATRNPLLPWQWVAGTAIAAVFAVLIALSAEHIARYGQHHFTDLYVYFGGGQAWRQGLDLYQAKLATPFPGFTLGFTYPPLAAVAFAGLTFFPLHTALVLFTAASVVALFLIIWLALNQLRRSGFVGRYPIPLLALILTLPAIWLDPVKETISFGQVNLLLVLLVAADCLVAKPWWPRGLLIGLAAAIKLTPAAFVLFFLAHKQWKSALVSVAGFLGFGLVGFLVAKRDSVAYWFTEIMNTDRIGNQGFNYNQSLRGTLARIGISPQLQTPLWIILCLAALVATILIVHRARLIGYDLVAMVAVGAFSLLVSPVSWVHHWVWVVPGLVLAVALTLRTRSWPIAVFTVITGVVFWYPLYPFVPELRDGGYWNWWQNIVGNADIWLALAVLIALLIWLPRTPLASESSRNLTGEHSPVAQSA